MLLFIAIFGAIGCLFGATWYFVLGKSKEHVAEALKRENPPPRQETHGTTDKIEVIPEHRPEVKPKRTSLKQRTQNLANEFYEWAEKKNKEAPEVTIIQDGSRSSDQWNAYQSARMQVYVEQARVDYDKENFGPRIAALVGELTKCGIDVEHRPFWTNPIMMGNLTSVRSNALVLRQIAVELPNDDAALNCRK